MADLAKAVPGRYASDLTGDVLVVDDEEDVRELLAEHFRNKGLQVTAVADGHGAIVALSRDPARFALVVTDLQLPGTDGFGVLRAARDANPSCAVVIVTGYASLESAVQAVRLGASDYLTKPFSLGQLDVIVHRIGDRMALEAENRRLARQLGQRDAIDVRPQVLARLEAIEARLARIELALGDLQRR